MTRKLVNPRLRSSDDGMGTSYLRMTTYGIKSTENTLAKVSHQGRSVFLNVVVYDKHSTDLLNETDETHIHENLENVFPTNEIVPSKDFVVDTDVKMEDVPECSEAQLHLRSSGKITEDRLAEVLEKENFLLHKGITEVINTESSIIEFEVLGLHPDRSTAKVTHNTELEFVDQSEKENLAVDDPRSSGTGGSNDEMDVNIDVTPSNPTESFEDDVAGMEPIKEEAERIITLFDPQKKQIIENKYGEEFADRGNGLLLYGPPGCGKTLVSEAIANEIQQELSDEYGDVRFIQMKGSQIESRYPGESERRIEYIFNKAREFSEEGFVVLFFDEIETLLPDRGDENLKRHDSQITNAFLQEMNDVSDDLLVMGATNFPNEIDPAADRRFPMKVFTPPPDKEVMEQVWRKNLPKEIDLSTEDIEELAKASIEYTPAEIVDEVLGGELQRELVLSVAEGDPIDLDKKILLEKLEDKEPETISKYIDSIGNQNLEGYSELDEFVRDQIQKRMVKNSAEDSDGD